eukprot:g12465.t1
MPGQGNSSGQLGLGHTDFNLKMAPVILDKAGGHRFAVLVACGSEHSARRAQRSPRGSGLYSFASQWLQGVFAIDCKSVAPMTKLALMLLLGLRCLRAEDVEAALPSCMAEDEECSVKLLQRGPGTREARSSSAVGAGCTETWPRTRGRPMP